jgi:Phage integrase, N-terminal SAM-like domain
MTLIAATLQGFFTDRLIRQSQASPRTVAAYRDTAKLLLAFVHQQTGKTVSFLDWSDLDATMITRFLNQLESDRHNSIRTRNLRLTAIRSLFTHAALHHPEHALLIQRVLAIPPKRFDKRDVTFLTATEIDALLAAPDLRRWEGRRDRALMTSPSKPGCASPRSSGSTAATSPWASAPTSAAKAKAANNEPFPSPPRSPSSCKRGWTNGPESPTNHSSPPGQDAGLAATRSRCGSAPTPPQPPPTVPPCLGNVSTPTSSGTAAR